MNPCIGMTLHTGDFQIDRAFRIALGDMLGNVVYYQSGLLESPAPCLVAGLSYPDPWTRDAAINTWNGAGLLIPEVMRNTLLASLTRGDASAGFGVGCEDLAGSQVPSDVLSISGQYWDRIIWTIGAWAFYEYTGDRAFLSQALEAVRNSLTYLEEQEYDAEMGLFRGGACIHDGIGAYSDIYIDQNGTAIFDWPADNPLRRHPKGAGVPIFALSTNCLYAEAYRLAGRMAKELGEEADPQWEAMRMRVTEAIRSHFWMAEGQYYRFYLDPWGGCEGRQEALGNAFLLLFGIPRPEQCEAIITHQPLSDYGPRSIWPEWLRYAQAQINPYETPPGREDIAAENQVLRGDPRSKTWYGGHGGAVWPMIQGFWADAVLRQGRLDLFDVQLRLMAESLCRAVQSPEVVHPDCGLPYGGLQEMPGHGPITRWVSCYRQTWSATAYLRLVLHGVVGLRCQPDGLTFAPALPEDIDSITLQGLPWRNSTLHLTITRSTGRQDEVRVDGNVLPSGCIPGDLAGDHTLEVLWVSGNRSA